MTHDFDLSGKVILITGTAKGIGAETAKRAASLGATIVGADIDEAGAQTTADIIAQAGGTAGALAIDVTSETDWQRTVDAVRSDYGRLDGLVNNAGIIMMKATEDTTLEDWRRVNSINVEGVFLGTRTALPLMRETAAAHGTSGSIVNLSSIYGITGEAGFAAYCASKGAVRMMTKACALEFGRGGFNVRVNSVHPGPIDTDLGTGPLKDLQAIGLLDSMETGMAAVRERFPIGRWGEVQDIAKGITFLLSDASSFMTGTELVIDGGWSAY